MFLLKFKKLIMKFLMIIVICVFFLNLEVKQKNEINASLKDEGLKQDLLIGTAVNGVILERDYDYANKIKQEFSIITPENEMKFSVIHPNENEFAFEKADKIVEFAQENKIKVRGHTLVWNNRIPEWLDKGNYTKDEMEQILKTHIITIMNRYKGKIYAWDVVNEAFNNDGSLKDSIWLKTIGPDYIKKSFIWAKETDPNALLFYNDYGGEITNEKSDAIYHFLKKLQQEGTPVEGIGFQFHTSLHQKFTEKEIIKNMKRFRDIGLKINVTELDVKLSDSPGFQKSKLMKQAKQYSVVLNSCKNLKKSCTVFGMWGFTDKYTWLKNDNPLIFNEFYKPKPSYYAIKQILQNK